MAQVEPTEFALTLKARSVARPAWQMLWRASGTEKGSAAFLKQKGLPIVVQQPPGDKLVSATAVAAAWNDGRVLLPDPEAFPEVEQWVYRVVSAVMDFTGTGKEKDDVVDGLGNAHKLLEVGDGGKLLVVKRGN